MLRDTVGVLTTCAQIITWECFWIYWGSLVCKMDVVFC